MRYAIVTKFITHKGGPGSRIKATCALKSLTVPYDLALSSGANHRAVAQALATKLGWSGRWCGGTLPDGKNYAFTQVDADGHAESDEQFVVKLP